MIGQGQVVVGTPDVERPDDIRTAVVNGPEGVAIDRTQHLVVPEVEIHAAAGGVSSALTRRSLQTDRQHQRKQNGKEVIPVIFGSKLPFSGSWAPTARLTRCVMGKDKLRHATV